MYLKIRSSDKNSVLINVDRINFVREENKGCRIYFDDLNISTSADFADVESALVFLESENEDISLLPEEAIVLTKKEIAALNEYQKKLDAGGDALEKE